MREWGERFRDTQGCKWRGDPVGDYRGNDVVVGGGGAEDDGAEDGGDNENDNGEGEGDWGEQMGRGVRSARANRGQRGR